MPHASPSTLNLPIEEESEVKRHGTNYAAASPAVNTTTTTTTTNHGPSTLKQHPAVTPMTPTTLTLSVLLLSLLTAAPTLPHSLRAPLLAAHLRTHHALLLPAPDGSVHLAVNYHNAGKDPLATALAGPGAPFVACELGSDVLGALRSFTLVVPTAEGWVGEEEVVKRRQVGFLDAVAAGAGVVGDCDPLVLQDFWCWGTVSAAAEVEKRKKWVGAVGRGVRALGQAMAGALFADGEKGEEARSEMCGEVVFQEWCDGWGGKCGADDVLVRKVADTVAELERCYGRRMRGRLVVAEETMIGGWGEVGWDA